MQNGILIYQLLIFINIHIVTNGLRAFEIFFDSTGSITPKVPASILQIHPDVTVVYDVSAYSELE